MQVTAYTYDKKAALLILKNVLNQMLLFGTEKLISVNDDSIRVADVLSRSDNPFVMKATTELDATISYNFEDDSNNLTKKLKDLIVGSDTKEAQSILLNDSNIAGVQIDFSPFWMTHVSGNPDNIDFVIRPK